MTFLAGRAAAMTLVCSLAAAEPGSPWLDAGRSPDERASLAVAAMTLDEKIGLLHGPMALPYVAHGVPVEVPAGAILAAGFIPGIRHLGAGAAVRGTQDQHVISTVKHFALNANETNRQFLDARIARRAVFFDAPLRAAVADGSISLARIDDMVHRILRSMFAVGVVDQPPAAAAIDYAAHGALAREIARKGIVLLKNDSALLPLGRGPSKIAVIGGYANSGVLSGGGSAQVIPANGPFARVPGGVTANGNDQIFDPSAPLAAIQATSPQSVVSFDSGAFPARAAALAARTDMAIVFVTQPQMEGSNVGYRWYRARGLTPLFAFGYGLSFSRFAYRDVTVAGGDTLTVALDVSNRGTTRGADVAPVYLTSAAGVPVLRLIGFQRIELEAGQSRRITLTADPRLLGTFDEARRQWRIKPGVYKIRIGQSAVDLGSGGEATINGI